MTYYNQRDDLLRVLDHLDIETAVLLGHSMGGKTAMVTALTYVGTFIFVFVVAFFHNLNDCMYIIFITNLQCSDADHVPMMLS